LEGFILATHNVEKKLRFRFSKTKIFVVRPYLECALTSRGITSNKSMHKMPPSLTYVRQMFKREDHI